MINYYFEKDYYFYPDDYHPDYCKYCKKYFKDYEMLDHFIFIYGINDCRILNNKGLCKTRTKLINKYLKK